MFVCCECCVLPGKGLCDELITRPEESYRLWCVVVCDLETSRIKRPWPALGLSAKGKKKSVHCATNVFSEQPRGPWCAAVGLRKQAKNRQYIGIIYGTCVPRPMYCCISERRIY